MSVVAVLDHAPLRLGHRVEPSRTNPFAQEEWGAFATATRFLGRHHAELEPVDPTAPEEACLVAIRFLIYAIEAKRSPDAEGARLA